MYTVTRVSDEGQEILDTLATGYCPGCPECPTEDQIGLAEDEGYISRFPCDMCGDDLLGMRYAAHALDREGAVLHFDVCADCFDRINAA